MDFWKEKIPSNVARDKRYYEKLSESGWNIIIIWECLLEKTIRKMTLSQVIEIVTTKNNHKL